MQTTYEAVTEVNDGVVFLTKEAESMMAASWEGVVAVTNALRRQARETNRSVKVYRHEHVPMHISPTLGDLF